MQITKEMFDDWCSPDGYSDFREGTKNTNQLLPYRGAFAVYRPKRHEDREDVIAIEAHSGGWRGQPKKQVCPQWLSQGTPEFDNAYCELFPPRMAEPDFSLDEIFEAQEMIHGKV